jgi:hypothetical protein
MSLIWRAENPHPVLAELRDFCIGGYTALDTDVWLPAWAGPPVRPR